MNYKTYLAKQENNSCYYVTRQYKADYLFNEYKKGNINLDLDCQRDYVWDEKKQQEFWDTLLNGNRIPELHAQEKDNILYILDGKQRLTTLWKILNNEIPLSYKTIKDQEFLEVAVEKPAAFIKTKKVYFNELKTEVRKFILDTTITVAEYSNMTDYELTKLFRKLNTSSSLSDFLKELSRNLILRKEFTSPLLSHNVFKWINNKKPHIKQSEKNEQILIRMLMLKQNSKQSLQPSEICRNMNKINTNNLKHYYSLYEELLNKVEKETLESLIECWSSWETNLPILFYCLTEYPLTKAQVNEVISNEILLDIKPKAHSNLVVKEIEQRIKIIKEIIENI